MSKPEDRYVELRTKILPNGRIVYRSARPRPVKVDETTDFQLVATERTRMDVIAHNVFGSSTEWWRIAAANKRVDGSLHMLPNKNLIIPKKT